MSGEATPEAVLMETLRRAVFPGLDAEAAQRTHLEALDALAALASLRVQVDQAERACNICGKPWPHHYEHCAYPSTVRELAACREALREIEREGNAQGSRDGAHLAAIARASLGGMADGGGKTT